jgi:hypothetical protein
MVKRLKARTTVQKYLVNCTGNGTLLRCVIVCFALFYFTFLAKRLGRLAASAILSLWSAGREIAEHVGHDAYCTNYSLRSHCCCMECVIITYVLCLFIVAEYIVHCLLCIYCVQFEILILTSPNSSHGGLDAETFTITFGCWVLVTGSTSQAIPWLVSRPHRFPVSPLLLLSSPTIFAGFRHQGRRGNSDLQSEEVRAEKGKAFRGPVSTGGSQAQ